MPGRSAAWLARLPWEQEVGRSNRLAPTITFSMNSNNDKLWFNDRTPAEEQEGAVATNKERLLARRREGEAAGPAVEVLRHRRRLPGDEINFDIVPSRRALTCQIGWPRPAFTSSINRQGEPFILRWLLTRSIVRPSRFQPYSLRCRQCRDLQQVWMPCSLPHRLLKGLASCRIFCCRDQTARWCLG